MRRVSVAVGAAALFALPAQAQDVPAVATGTIPDPATVEVPAISGGRDPKVVKNGSKYYYFWRPDTSYETAYMDFADCYRFLPMAEGNAALLPMFIAWSGVPEDRDDTSPPVNNYGMVGALLGALVRGSGAERARQTRLHRCLGPLGYRRYPVPKATWQQIIDDFSMSSIAVGAKIASGPKPDAEALAEEY